MEVRRYAVGPLDNNVYILLDLASGCCAIVDPSFESQYIWDLIVQEGLTLQWVINTHAHIDHVVENRYFVTQSRAPLALHPGEKRLLEAMSVQAKWMGIEPPEPCDPDYWLAEGERIKIGHGSVKVVMTPGHSPASISLVGDDFVICGDALFAGSIGRTDLPGGDLPLLLKSIRVELLTLPDETVVYPGHGEITTIGAERRLNPYLAE